MKTTDFLETCESVRREHASAEATWRCLVIGLTELGVAACSGDTVSPEALEDAALVAVAHVTVLGEQCEIAPARRLTESYRKVPDSELYRWIHLRFIHPEDS